MAVADVPAAFEPCQPTGRDLAQTAALWGAAIALVGTCVAGIGSQSGKAGMAGHGHSELSRRRLGSAGAGIR